MRLRFITSILLITIVLTGLVCLSAAEQVPVSGYEFLNDYIESLESAARLQPCMQKVNVETGRIVDNAEKIDLYRSCYEEGVDHLRGASSKIFKYVGSSNPVLVRTVEQTRERFDLLVESLLATKKIYDEIYVLWLKDPGAAGRLEQFQQGLLDQERERRRLDLSVVTAYAELRPEDTNFTFTDEEKTALRSRFKELFGTEIADPDWVSPSGPAACGHLIYHGFLKE